MKKKKTVKLSDCNNDSKEESTEVCKSQKKKRKGKLVKGQKQDIIQKGQRSLARKKNKVKSTKAGSKEGGSRFISGSKIVDVCTEETNTDDTATHQTEKKGNRKRKADGKYIFH